MMSQKNSFTTIDLVELPGIDIDRPKLLEFVRFFSKFDGTCLLYSGAAKGAEESHLRSFLCLFPFETIEPNNSDSSINPWDLLKSQLTLPNEIHSFPDWIGFLGYGMGAYVDDEFPISMLPSTLPNYYFQRCALILEIDHQNQKARMIISQKGKASLGQVERQWLDTLADVRSWPGLFKRLAGPHIAEAPIPNAYSLYKHESQESYCQKVLQAQEWIKAGDLYQINLSQEFTFKGQGDAFQIFKELSLANPAPFAAYLKLKDFVIISSSPESFLRKKQSILETRPIKGTAPRSSCPNEDLHNKEKLLESEKERAELLMIVDLMRNDLGKISLPGSVKTKEIWGCEAYTNVFHMVATIQSELQPQHQTMDILRACFPGGSITGCPKLKAMEHIAELEQRPRGIYTGSIGYITGDGDFDFNIAIRTLVVQGDTVEVQLGGAVVFDSDPTNEYVETLHKGQTIFKVLGVNTLTAQGI